MKPYPPHNSNTKTNTKNTNTNNSHKPKYTKAIATIALTGLVSLGGSLTAISSAFAGSMIRVSQENIQTDNQTVVAVNSLPRSVRTAVLRDIARREDIPTRKLEVISATPRTWRNGCLELPRRGELCTQALVSGWRVVVSDRTADRNWVYHTNGNGRVLRRATSSNQTPIPDALPSSVRNAVLKAASKRLNVSTSRLTIMRSQQREWRNGCLEIVIPDRVCTQVIVPGWRVVVGAQEQTLVYHTDRQGRLVVLNVAESTIADNLPGDTLDRRTRLKVLEFAEDITGISTQNLRIASVKQITVDGCLGLPGKNEPCTKIAQSAYRVAITSEKTRLVVHTLPNGEQIRIDEAASRLNLPPNIAERIERDVRRRTNAREISIIDSKRKRWSNGCLDIPNTSGCSRGEVPGWLVRVRADGRVLVYHTDTFGKQISFNSTGSNSDISLSRTVRDRLLTKVAKIADLNQDSLRIIDVESATWNPTPECFGANIKCRPPEPISGIKVTVTNSQDTRNQNRWVLFSDNEGRQTKLSPEVLPNAVRAGILRRAEERANLPAGAGEEYVEFLSYKRVPVIGGTQPRWQVKVQANGIKTENLVFIADNQGSSIQLVNSQPGENNLSSAERDRILTFAAKTTEQPKNSLRILSSEFIPASDGWKLTIGSERAPFINRWVFTRNSEGELTLVQRFRETRDAQLPTNIRTKVLNQAARQSSIAVSQLKIEDVIFRQYPDACGGIIDSNRACATVITSSWEVKIRTPRQTLVYDISESGSIALRVRTNNETVVQSVPIPSNELPPPLESGVLFRQVSSGGIAGQTYETVLLDDGRLIQTRLGDSSDRDRRVFRVTPAQMQQFIQLLSQQEEAFQNNFYPTTPGAADYMTYTLTSANGTIQYSDVSQGNLPGNLMQVIQAWQEIQQNMQF